MANVAVVGLGYGDEGKGSIVDFLASSRSNVCVIRCNGHQASHNVVTIDGRHHAFSQFGSAMFHPDATTHLSRFMMVEPAGLLDEAAHLEEAGVDGPLDRLSVHPDALITTPYHMALNRDRERGRGIRRHGSCGVGIWETQVYGRAFPTLALRAGDLKSPSLVRTKLSAIEDWASEHCSEPVEAYIDRKRYLDDYATFAAMVAQRSSVPDGNIIFEGAQGVLLDEWHGFHPYTTGSTTTFAPFDAIANEYGLAAPLRLGVTRCFMTRHGPGPFVTEDTTLVLSEPHNRTGRFSGPFRTGHIDLVALRYAIEVCGGIDYLAVTHLDQLSDDLKMCVGYRDDFGMYAHLSGGDLDYMERTTIHLFETAPMYSGHAVNASSIAAGLGVPLSIESYGPTMSDKRMLAVTSMTA